MKQSPRNTVLGPPSRSDVPLGKWDEAKLQVLRERPKTISHGTAYGMRIRNEIMKSNSSRHVETTTDVTCVTCQKVRLICSEGLKRCFEDFASLRNCHWIQFTSSLTWCCSCDSSPGKHWMIQWNLAKTIYSYADCLQNLLSVFSLVPNLIILRSDHSQ